MAGSPLKRTRRAARAADPAIADLATTPPVVDRGQAQELSRARASARGRRYSPTEREEALEVVRLAGFGEAVRVTAIPVVTLSRWAIAAGIEPFDEAKHAEQVAAEARARRLAIAERTDATATAMLEDSLTRMGRVIATQVAYSDDLTFRATRVDPNDVEITYGEDGQQMARTTDPEYLEAKARAAVVFSSSPISFRDLVNGYAQLAGVYATLRGNVSGSVTVTFGIPRPRASESDAQAEVIDLTPSASLRL